MSDQHAGSSGRRKRRFLTVYDYGQGGVWISLLADSEQHIAQRYPQLEIIEKRPEWMSEDELRDIEARRTVDIDDHDDPFPRDLREGRRTT